MFRYQYLLNKTFTGIKKYAYFFLNSYIKLRRLTLYIHIHSSNKTYEVYKRKNIFEDETQFELMLLPAGETPNVSG